jgi:hypothetical protein
MEHPARWFSEPEAFGTTYSMLLLEQYKLYVETTNKVSDRRGSAHTMLLTVNTSLITVYGFFLGKEGVASTGSAPWSWMMPIAGLLISLAWFLLIRSYRALNGAKFEVIREIEARLPARVFDLEWQFLGRGQGRMYRPLTHLEQYIPLVFALCYLVALVAALHLR